MRAVIGMGSNRGKPERNILAAADALDHLPGLTPVGLSSGYWSDPIGPPQPRFLNAAMLVESSLSLKELLASLLGLEVGLGRRRTTPRGPRTIDLDLLFADDRVEDDQWIVVPHPRLTERAFALLPLLELWPDAIDPATGEALQKTLIGLDDRGVDPPQPLPLHVERQDFDHTADLSFSVTGTTGADTLRRAAMAFVDLLVDRSKVVERERHVIDVQGDDSVELMVVMLSEILFLLDARQFVPRRVNLLSSAKNTLRLAVYGEQLRAEEQLEVHVKAVTYHEAAFSRDADSGRWTISVVVDV